MPELPEVETSVRGISPYLVGKTIKEIIIRQKQLRWLVSDELNEMQNAQITAISRRAKYLIIHTTKGEIVIHLGMSGSLSILEKETKDVGKHDHVDLVTQDGIVLRYNDPRRFGAWLWAERADQLSILQKLGLEPLSAEFNGDYLYRKSRNRKVAVKKFIMDNAVVVGVGNIYACESLFLAKILPERLACTLTKEQSHLLVTIIKQVLTKAIEQGGTTLKDFVQPDGKPGYFAQVLQVYGRKGEECHQCQNQIKTKIIGQRNTFYCENCQQ
ncbi:bifunctional DNA-formamidopyrimidine glycosylase/DNA-(apurinic or apyrimidinic site) lyase [Pasteurella atlantica]|uniref:Bifunctional DNA-formamidopyrimidine glycosylase/DNA-(Apurinic or apyrimidinic site) lyase n=2 Tax=Pasteurellaceae TaxID=712 RepID=A0ACC6HP82_9PAST|nr:bifunctional DNA-formamidopyrimidine glycosylase/DNA-(apurinic or apyrimidinic site) lyase [Pasteurella atlantica]MDP8052677.1 bifunctional DNA-formamidopyrimidine glycosylase/DNA-(apurinic or apyrimidinic site) lyase [Pasteurella atlantica]MDP8105928.1 bifunctional DNA-formamidopyrimidine glycosylase/DNA-(apurinic or apyrimidinic site) lyase [Pasteurella atlantica]MDP8149314.1 bifunctional DNA-formamidopyrimidine glycosylase/DNA-(apurinic or apyrimidinic site) lyase [Pasteurella atlantica]